MYETYFITSKDTKKELITLVTYRNNFLQINQLNKKILYLYRLI